MGCKLCKQVLLWELTIPHRGENHINIRLNYPPLSLAFEEEERVFPEGFRKMDSEFRNRKISMCVFLVELGQQYSFFSSEVMICLWYSACFFLINIKYNQFWDNTTSKMNSSFYFQRKGNQAPIEVIGRNIVLIMSAPPRTGPDKVSQADNG